MGPQVFKPLVFGSSGVRGGQGLIRIGENIIRNAIAYDTYQNVSLEVVHFAVSQVVNDLFYQISASTASVVLFKLW